MQPGSNTNETNVSLWNAALSVGDSPSKGRGRTKKADTIVHPEFEAASECVNDKYWKDTLTRCARNKFPRGFSYSDRYLHHRQNDISILLPDDALPFAQTAVYFFQENGKLYSQRDQEQRRHKYEQEMIAQMANESNNWKALAHSKNRRANSIRDYVDHHYGHLPTNIRDELCTQIDVGFELDYVNKNDVTFENGRILHIDGFDADEEKVIFTRPYVRKKLPIIDQETPPKIKLYQHYDNWMKYLENYQKYVVSSAKSSHIIQTSGSIGTDQHDVWDSDTDISNFG